MYIFVQRFTSIKANWKPKVTAHKIQLGSVSIDCSLFSETVARSYHLSTCWQTTSSPLGASLSTPGLPQHPQGLICFPRLCNFQPECWRQCKPWYRDKIHICISTCGKAASTEFPNVSKVLFLGPVRQKTPKTKKKKKTDCPLKLKICVS